MEIRWVDMSIIYYNVYCVLYTIKYTPLSNKSIVVIPSTKFPRYVYYISFALISLSLSHSLSHSLSLSLSLTHTHTYVYVYIYETFDDNNERDTCTGANGSTTSSNGGLVLFEVRFYDENVDNSFHFLFDDNADASGTDSSDSSNDNGGNCSEKWC